MNNKQRLTSPDDAITEQTAARLVKAGQYDTVKEAWGEAIALCHETDAYETNPTEEDNMKHEKLTRLETAQILVGGDVWGVQVDGDWSLDMHREEGAAIKTREQFAKHLRTVAQDEEFKYTLDYVSKRAAYSLMLHAIDEITIEYGWALCLRPPLHEAGIKKHFTKLANEAKARAELAEAFIEAAGDDDDETQQAALTCNATTLDEAKAAGAEHKRKKAAAAAEAKAEAEARAAAEAKAAAAAKRAAKVKKYGKGPR